MKPSSALRHAAIALTMSMAFISNVDAESSSEVSEASSVPVAISVALPVVSVAGVASIVVTGVQAGAEGTVWIVEGAADGLKGSICFARQALGASAIAVGTVVVVTVVATGMVLSVAGHVIAFIPNEIGRTLSYNQLVSQ